jgi:hypothetical protein
MIVYADLYDAKKGYWFAVQVDVRKDGKETGHRLVIDVVLRDDDGEGPALRLTSDQAAKLLAGIGEVLGS